RRSSEGLVGEVKVWDTADGRLLFSLTEPGLWPRRLAFDPAGRNLALAAAIVDPPTPESPLAAREPVVRILDATSGRIGQQCEGLKDLHFLGLAFSPDSARLALAGGESQSLHIWNVVTGEVLLRSNQVPSSAMDLAFSPDGRRLAIAARLQVKILDAATGEGVLILRGLSQVVPNTHG